MMRTAATTLSLVAAFSAGCDATAAQTSEWQLDHYESDGALMSVWGTSEDSVWAAGGQRGDALLLHWSGEEWSDVAVDAPGMLSWTYGFTDDDIYAVGEAGLILHYDGIEWTQIESSTDKPLYGVWGRSGNDVWIVGGDPFGATGEAVILRGDRSGFAPAADIPTELLPSALYKAYGSPSDLVFVGTDGAVLRFDGDAWHREESGTNEPLFSLWGRTSDDIYAVGGIGRSELLHYDGSGWTRVTDDDGTLGLSGVFTAVDQPTIAVGSSAYVVEIDDSGAIYEPHLPSTHLIPELHGVWGDGHGTAFAVGGDLFAYPDKMTGVIYRRTTR